MVRIYRRIPEESLRMARALLLVSCFVALAVSSSLAVCVVYSNVSLVGRSVGFATWYLEECAPGAGAVINGSYVLAESTPTPTSFIYGEQLCDTVPTDDAYFRSDQDDLSGEATAPFAYTTTYASVYSKAKLVCTATVGSCLIDVVTVCLNDATDADPRTTHTKIAESFHGFTYEHVRRLD